MSGRETPECPLPNTIKKNNAFRAGREFFNFGTVIPQSISESYVIAAENPFKHHRV